MTAKGLKIQVFGGMLLALGAVTAILARVIGFELDPFYMVIGAAGALLFLYGTVQNHTS
ncbi:MAG: hypothetical protein GY934_02860 [Gammaproteobacteria bacterium]|nr:hypothetical protein [Gammaproteobacteria bacterium]